MSNVFKINDNLVSIDDNPEAFDDIRKILDILNGKKANDVMSDLICLISIVVNHGVKSDKNSVLEDVVRQIHEHLDEQIRLDMIIRNRL